MDFKVGDRVRTVRDTTAPHTKGVNMEKLREMAKKPPSKASPPGWTFRAAPSDFDGPRILRELEAQGAQYAVIVWGKGEDERIAVVSQGLFDRMDKLPDSTLPNAVGTSYYRVTDFGPGKQLVEDASETVAGWHESTRADGTPCRLGDLKALAGRVEACEQANSEVRVYVAYGQAGDK